MAELVFRPPNALLFVALGIVAVGVISVFLKKGEVGRKVLSVAIVVVVAGAVLLFLYRSTTLTIDRTGVRATGTGAINLSWDEVDRVVLERNLATSEYRPTVRSRGVAIGSYRTGRFSLSNGSPGQVLMERSDQAAILVADDRTYLLAPEDTETLFEAIREFAGTTVITE